MHVRVRIFGKPDVTVLVESKLTKIEKFRRLLHEKFDVHPNVQRLFYGGKLLDDGYSFHDYNIKHNDVIQLMVKIQPAGTLNKKKDKVEKATKESEYRDAVSVFYEVGDYVDVKYKDLGAWLEGEIVRIVHDPKSPSSQNSLPENPSSEDKENYSASQSSQLINGISNPSHDTDMLTSENALADVSSTDDTKYNMDSSIELSDPKNRICNPFGPATKKLSFSLDSSLDSDNETDSNLLYKVEIEDNGATSFLFCNLDDIRPRAIKEIAAGELECGQTVLLNYNPEQPEYMGHWYDYTITDIKKKRGRFHLSGTIYVGADAVPQTQTNVIIRDKVFAIEKVVPLAKRTKIYKKLIQKIPVKRTKPVKCMSCGDIDTTLCKECSCSVCGGREHPDKTLLCDECDKGYHMACLDPVLKELPEGDWYCPSCKRDPNEVVAPGAAKQAKKREAKTKRDWGRGMACAGTSKTCSMPANHFGPIPGIDVGMRWRFRIQVAEAGVHRPPVSGIHGRDCEGAFSLVLSGGYEDDVDNGNEFTYTGSGGRDLSGNKRTADQSCDQTLTRVNKALARNCACKIGSDGGDAGKKWREGLPVRVVRSYKMLTHFPKYAPKEGNRYDGIYKVVKYYPERGLSGFLVWKYLLRRDDPAPAPWEPEAVEFPMVFPDGYLEAEAEKKVVGAKKRGSRKPSQDEAGPPKIVKTKGKVGVKGSGKNVTSSSSQSNIKAMLKPASTGVEHKGAIVSEAEKALIEGDTLNTPLWEDCIKVCENQGRKAFIDQISQVFFCIICQEVVASPITTPCLHNFCLGCLKEAFKRMDVCACPCCRHDLTNLKLARNDELTAALRLLMPGYDAGKH